MRQVYMLYIARFHKHIFLEDDLIFGSKHHKFGDDSEWLEQLEQVILGKHKNNIKYQSSANYLSKTFYFLDKETKVSLFLRNKSLSMLCTQKAWEGDIAYFLGNLWRKCMFLLSLPLERTECNIIYFLIKLKR